MSFIGPSRPPPKDENKPAATGGDVQKKKVIGPSFGKDEDEEPPPQQTKKRLYGPSFGNDDEKPKEEKTENDEDKDAQPSPLKKMMTTPKKVIGPSFSDLRSGDDESDEDEEIGEWERVKRNQESSSTSSGSTLKRDEWMTTLPTDRTIGSQLGNRSFSKNQNVNVNKVESSWLEIGGGSGGSSSVSSAPNKPSQNPKNSPQHPPQPQPQQRAKSLLEMHQEKLKKVPGTKKPKEASGGVSFDRDKDMAMAKIDKEYLTKIVRESHELNDKFEKGK